MRFFVETARSALLSSKACLPPCPSVISALFSIDQDSFAVGGQITTNNLSVNANAYAWYINDILVSNAIDTTFRFDAEGTYQIRLQALSPLIGCYDKSYETTTQVVCPVRAAYSFSINGGWLTFQDQSENVGQVEWSVKNGLGATLFSSDSPRDSIQPLHELLLPPTFGIPPDVGVRMDSSSSSRASSS